MWTEEVMMVTNRFKEKYGTSPTFVVRSPGRVNLIVAISFNDLGEHIDYSDYGVLPMALSQSIWAAVSPNQTNTVTVANYDSSYKDFSTKAGEFVINLSSHEWYNYFLCGYRGMVEHLQQKGLLSDTSLRRGFDVLVWGHVPAGSGLSSSSALVVASALATLRALSERDFELVSRAEVAELTAKCEHYIGVEGGGMDQAICLLAEPEEAKYVTFNPLNSVNVKLPQSVTFVVANSCVQANKAAFAHYNERVVECRLATQLLALKLGLDWREFRKLGLLARALNLTPACMIQNVKDLLHSEPYSILELCNLFSIDKATLESSSLSAYTLHMTEFYLRQRAEHVYSEAARVLKFFELCKSADLDAESLKTSLGSLMNESHDSCQQLYDCSCPELDELVAVCRKAGALGSRLTGAGWGGCTVSLVDTMKDETDFLDKVKHNFYGAKEGRMVNVETALFVTSPSSGAEYFYLRFDNTGAMHNVVRA